VIMASKRSIIITKHDHERLENLFISDFAQAFSDKPYLQSLRSELDVATIVEREDVPSDVVTMNSKVRLRELRSSDVATYTLVYPKDADIAQGKLSVLAPIGTAILGYRVGDRIRWPAPGGTVRFQIEELIFQPERDGVIA
jgi:regulator of nucleoside diphosphate kinase